MKKGKSGALQLKKPSRKFEVFVYYKMVGEIELVDKGIFFLLATITVKYRAGSNLLVIRKVPDQAVIRKRPIFSNGFYSHTNLVRLDLCSKTKIL